jgi:low affinity Fe/Cu permease
VVTTSTEHVAADIDGRPRRFTRLAQRITIWSGSAAAALVVFLSLLIWVVVGVTTGLPRWWEVTAAVGLPFVTLLMLVLIQHTQNHDDQAVQLKLDELIRASGEASNRMMVVEESSQEDLNRVRDAFKDDAAR